MIQLYEYSFFRLLSILHCYKILNIVLHDIPINSCHCVSVNPIVFYTSPIPFPFGNLEFVFCLSEFVSLVCQFSSVMSDSLWSDPMNHSTPGLAVHHQLLEFTQTHVHRVGDAIQPPHPLSSPSPPIPNPSQHQSLFQWVNSSHEMAKVLEFQL